MPDEACVWCVVFAPPECLKPENCILSLALCCIFLQAKVVLEPRKQELRETYLGQPAGFCLADLLALLFIYLKTSVLR